MHDVDASANLGHAQWEASTAPIGEPEAPSKVFWRCVSCGVVVGFWAPGHGSDPTSTADAPPANVGAYSGRVCGT